MRPYRALIVGLLAVHPLMPLAAAEVPKSSVIAVPPLPGDYEDWVRKVVLNSLKDPDSAKLEYRTWPYRMLCKKGVYKTPVPTEIWVIDVYVNAKNSYGGYTGFDGWSVVMIPADQGMVKWQAYTELGGGPLTYFKLCKLLPE